MAAVAPGPSPTPQAQAPPRGNPQRGALPVYDLFLDLPHPAASSQCPPPFIVGAPSNSPEIEKELNSNLSRIGRFAFPEFDDAAAQKTPRDTALNRFSQYAMQPKGFQHYTFSLQLQSGVRLHGHVRRYLPTHVLAKSRYDVGRRGERALVILTRASGGDLVYSAILKTIDSITFQKDAVVEKREPHKEPQKWFLHKLFEQHRQLCAQFAALPQQERRPLVLSIAGIEIGPKSIPILDQVDTSKFLIPTSLLTPTSSIVESVTSSSILPVLRVMGVHNSLRLLSALLCESRILLISASPTRLAQCARSALSILAQGLLNWQHLYIPVLPPHLFQYLAAPVPYLIGMLTSMAPRLDQVQGLGELVIINLDNFQMETRGINPMEVAHKIPDLFRTAMAEQGLPAASMSATEMLAQDLVDLLKVDKRSLYGESALTNVSETAAKATKAVKTGFLKLKEKGKKFLKNRSSTISADSASGDEDDLDPNGEGAPDHNTLLADFIYTQGSQNEAAEEEARIAFSSFFLSLFGNMRWYLSATPGKLPQLDRKRFLQQKRAMGEGENTPIWPLLQNFCQTQMLEEFAKARVEEVRTRHLVTSDSSLFTQCADYHRLHSIDFSVVNVRRVARQVAQNSPSRQILQTTARRTTMLLTSNRTFEGDYNKAVAQLVEQCGESSSVLFDVMSVIWVRLRDSKGLHWKHGFQALQILRNLLYHGPLAAIAEATDGLDKIRVMKFYNDNMRSQICTQLRQAANQVYNLLVDRAKLFNIRRLCVNKRRLMRKADPGRLLKDSRMKITTPFNKMHMAFNPRSRAQIAPAPGRGAVASTAHFAAEQDLLGLTATAGAVQAPPVSDPFAPVQSDPAQDMMGLFQGVSVSNNPAPAHDPFAAADTAPVHDPFAATPAQPQAARARTHPPPAQQAPIAGQVEPPQGVYQTQAAPSQYQPQTYVGQHAQQQLQAAPLGHPPNQPYQPPNQAPQQGQHVQQGYPPQQQQAQYPPGQQPAYGAPAQSYYQGAPPPQHYQQQARQQQGYPAAPNAQQGQGTLPKSNVSQFDPFK